MISNVEQLKQQAAEKAVEFVQSGMVVGLGTGSTAVFAVRAIGRRLQDGRLRDIVGIPTSETTAQTAKVAGIPLTTLDDAPVVDLTIDGADEIDPELDLIKGLGGALLREKIVAVASKQVCIIGDERKQVSQLGSRAPVPVEVIPFARQPVTAYLESLGAKVVLRQRDGRIFRTDEGNIILDCHFGLLEDPAALEVAIRVQPGVVEHGLFLGIATRAVIASAGEITVRERP